MSDAAKKEGEYQTFAMLCHLLALSGYIGIPFGNILGPLIIWLIKKDESELVDGNGKSALNFQITFSLVCILLGFGALAVMLIGAALGTSTAMAKDGMGAGMVATYGLGVMFYVLIGVAALLNFIFVIIGSVKANGGEIYKYPFTIRFIK